MDESRVAIMNFCLSWRVQIAMLQDRLLLWVLFVLLLSLISCREKNPPERKTSSSPPFAVTNETTVSDFLESLGLETKNSPPGADDPGLIKAGEELVLTGRLPNASGQRLSSYFYCADCHHSHREHSELRPIPERDFLEHAVANDLPLLPASSFAGITNREGHFKNEIAALYEPTDAAQLNLEDAVQFCSTEIARGRRLNAVEMQALLAYLHSLEWRINDLGIRGADLSELKRRAINPREHRKIGEDISSRFPSQVIASVDREDNSSETLTALDPNPQRGQQIWSAACLHCHGAEGASQHFFSNRKSTWKKLAVLVEDGSVARHIRGKTETKNDSVVVMPPFPLEKLSQKDIKDLETFLREQLPASE